jgi:hypothetical protein
MFYIAYRDWDKKKIEYWARAQYEQAKANAYESHKELIVRRDLQFKQRTKPSESDEHAVEEASESGEQAVVKA